MSISRGIMLCSRIFRQFGVRRLPKVVHQVRNYHNDDSNDWQISKGYSDGTFDPRVDTRHYKSFSNENTIEGIRRAIRETESRRRVTQDTTEHQRRQARIIEENRRKWQNRAEPKSPGALQYEKIHSQRKQQQKSEEDEIAEEYSRKRRHARLAEKERQDRELQESRKGYNLPETDSMDDSADDPEPPAYRMDRKNYGEEKYWHTWTTCPRERSARKEKVQAAEDQQDSDDSSLGFKSDSRRGFIKPTKPYDNTVRRFQTHSRQFKGASALYAIAQQYQKQDNRERQWVNLSAKTRRSSDMGKKYGFSTSSRYDRNERVYKTNANEMPTQFPNMKLSWQRVQSAALKHVNDVNRAVSQKYNHQDKAKKCVLPPRFNMTIRTGGAKRKRPPIESFSSMLAVDTHFTPYSEYTGYSRETVCDAWKNFKHSHNFKPKY